VSCYLEFGTWNLEFEVLDLGFVALKLDSS
jgi:hypothetical protein